MKKIDILFASRLVEEKWVDIVIDVIKRSITDSSLSENIHWHITSDWIYENEIRALQILYSEKITYYGKVNQAKLAALYRSCSLLLMPSRFLETFWMTALEATVCWVMVVWPKKWWLTPFIEKSNEIDQTHPVESIVWIIRKTILWENTFIKNSSLNNFSEEAWKERFYKIFPPGKRVMVIHDYKELIWWAEYYIETILSFMKKHAYRSKFYSYRGKTSIWKRRFVFILSIISFWRYFSLKKELEGFSPEAIWLHSVLRYIGPWGMYAVWKYKEKYPETLIILAHHDVGLLAAFPQYIEQESEIPDSRYLKDFIPKKLTWWKKILSISKWIYKEILIFLLPKNTKHMIFSDFLWKKIEKNFPWSEIILFPHTCNETLFFPWTENKSQKT